MQEDKVKQVIVMRTDLNMRKGKMVAQGAHACMIFLLRAIEECSEQDKIGDNPSIEAFFTLEELSWMSGSFTKVCLQGGNEDDVNAIYNKCLEEGISCRRMVDNGATEFNNVPTLTCIAIGPDRSSRIDRITGHLKLL